MFKNAMVRSLVQIVGLLVLVLFLGSTPTHAASFDECDDQFTACVERCGTWEWQFSYWRTVDDWCLNPQTQQWYHCGTHQEAVYDWFWTAHIDYWECQPGGGGDGICQCRY